MLRQEFCQVRRMNVEHFGFCCHPPAKTELAYMNFNIECRAPSKLQCFRRASNNIYFSEAYTLTFSTWTGQPEKRRLHVVGCGNLPPTILVSSCTVKSDVINLLSKNNEFLS
jgi:hypothetical protein